MAYNPEMKGFMPVRQLTDLSACCLSDRIFMLIVYFMISFSIKLSPILFIFTLMASLLFVNLANFGLIAKK
ncbi:hypothetical protein CVD23_10690 [Bacillus sp. V33-4]|nr:hypothetical protein CVD23_10690 [Bacillus sp. V33-4]